MAADSTQIEVVATKFVVVASAVGSDNRDMNGYGQFCPVARASEVFAERWTPLVLREVISGHHHFNEMLKGLHRISPSVLGQRLRSLERAGILETRPNPAGRGSTYYISPAGQPLADVVRALGIWGQESLELKGEDLDPDFLMWQIFKHLKNDLLPPNPRVVRFDFKGLRKSYWLVLRRDDPDLCYSDPGFGDYLKVRADLETLTRVYLGELDLKSASLTGLVEIEGPRDLVRSMPAWFPASGYAAYARPVRYDPVKRTFVRLEKRAQATVTA
jgi:DNA-binding HxlR family transcriptional regulator